MHDITIDDATGTNTPVSTVTAPRPPCPRTVRVDGGLDAEGACLGCGACLFAIFEPWA